MYTKIWWISFVYISQFLIKNGIAIRCFQCSSDQNKENDLCGAYEPFDRSRHVSVDCQSEEAVTPGILCLKRVEQSPRGFVWDGRWRSVQRRCASVSETGITGYCNWGHHPNGVYWEECYCSDDECNSGALYKMSIFTASSLVTVCLLITGTLLRT